MALVQYEGSKVPRWVARELRRARKQGWRGTVISGYRSKPRQLAAATAYAARLGRPLSSVYPHGVYASNHVGKRWPKGAVDVTDAAGLARALEASPAPRRNGRRLVWGGPVMGDWPHFSHNGH